VRLFGRKEGVDPATAAELAERGEAVLLDVREQREWDAGHAPGAVHIPLGQLAARLPELPQDRPVVAVCRSGSRSSRAVKALQRAGVEAENLDGGMRAWQRAGLPLEPAHGRIA
jgi:rhodanese-related sulfurtransferase